jgi:hypothetical protein
MLDSVATANGRARAFNNSSDPSRILAETIAAAISPLTHSGIFRRLLPEAYHGQPKPPFDLPLSRRLSNGGGQADVSGQAEASVLQPISVRRRSPISLTGQFRHRSAWTFSQIANIAERQLFRGRPQKARVRTSLASVASRTEGSLAPPDRTSALVQRTGWRILVSFRCGVA